MEKIVLKHEALNNGELRYQHLLGKEFKLGYTDCLAMLRSIFKDNLNIHITNYARPNDFWLQDINLYVDNYAKEGFMLIPDPQFEDLRPFDVFLIAIPDPRQKSATITNHCAIYLGDNTVISHRYGCLSSVSPYKGSLRQITTHTIRHKDVPDMRNTGKSKVDLMDLILPHKRVRLMEALNDAGQ